MDHIINTPCGSLRGTATRIDGVVAYKGIRYATAGRFEYPREVTSWEGVYDATEYGACSYQPRAFYNEEDMPKKIFYYNEFRKGEAIVSRLHSTHSSMMRMTTLFSDSSSSILVSATGFIS